MKLKCALLLTIPFAVSPVMADVADTDTEYPICKIADTNSRDNYVGVRVYFNEHSSYSYNSPDGHTREFIDDNLGFGTTVGNRLNDWFRVEYEALYMGANTSANDVNFEYDIWANLLNGYLYYEIDPYIAPYVGLGLGLTGIWGEIDGDLSNAFDFSYQVMLGVLLELNSRIELEVGFKYVDFGTVDHTRGATDVDATQIYIGAIYRFGM